MLRIISGKLKGRKLRTLKGQTARPTLEKTRETIFNTLQSHCDLSSFEAYDLFAGSGALGFEAYSRGVGRVFFTEIDRPYFALLRSNIQSLSLERVCSVQLIDALRWLKRPRWWEGRKLILLDPPYRTELAQEVVNMLSASRELGSGSIIVLETATDKTLSYPEHFQLFRQKMFGKTRVDFLETGVPTQLPPAV